MVRRLPSLNALRAFEASARHLSFTRAAEELNVTQAAISHQIKALEDELGFPVFRRLNRALMLTNEGQTLFPTVRDALDAIALSVDRLRERERAGTLTVSTLPSFAVKWLVPRLNRFQDRYPEIDFRLSASERVNDLGRDGIDVAIRFGRGNWPGVVAEAMFEERVTPVCGPSMRESVKSLADLSRVTLLHEEMTPIDDFPTWKTWLKAAGLPQIDAHRGPRFSHSHMMLQAAMDGQGVALAPWLLAADDVAGGRLIAPFDLRLATGCSYFLVYLPGAADRPKISAFRDWVRKEMKRPLISPVSSSNTSNPPSLPEADPSRRD